MGEDSLFTWSKTSARRKLWKIILTQWNLNSCWFLPRMSFFNRREQLLCWDFSQWWINHIWISSVWGIVHYFACKMCNIIYILHTLKWFNERKYFWQRLLTSFIARICLAPSISHSWSKNTQREHKFCLSMVISSLSLPSLFPIISIIYII